MSFAFPKTLIQAVTGLMPYPPKTFLRNLRGPGDYQTIRKFRGAPNQGGTGLILQNHVSHPQRRRMCER
jgi:hypothetical protein